MTDKKAPSKALLSTELGVSFHSDLVSITQRDPLGGPLSTVRLTDVELRKVVAFAAANGFS
jgi:hypothetical protein